MTKKDFIKEIREINKSFRGYGNYKSYGVLINNVYFCYDYIKLHFDDDLHELFIFARNRNEIVGCIHYQDIRIGLDA